MGREVTLLAASIFALVAFILVGTMFGFLTQEKQIENQAVTANTVRLDYMHADWCEYCFDTREDLELIVGQLSPHVQLRIWDEAMRENDAKTEQIYEKYMENRLFGGYPTIVANEQKMLVGKRDRLEIKEWICAQIENPPSECGIN